jgi:hypothetical protein
MGDAGFPCFLDVEATGFGPESYPIEIAWSDEHGEIHRCLIDPTPIATWTHWDAEAERVHGIDRERLTRNGWAPDYVATRLTDDLGGKTIYTDAPDYDARWVGVLFSAVGQNMPFRFEHIDELLLTILRKPEDAVWQAMVRIDELKREVGAVSSGKHSAGYDVGYLLQLWRRANGGAVKMNHGIGPLPETTATGTFARVKPISERHLRSASKQGKPDQG